MTLSVTIYFPVHRVAGLGECPTGPPVGGVTSTSTPALWPCEVLWPCTFCSDQVATLMPGGHTEMQRDDGTDDGSVYTGHSPVRSSCLRWNSNTVIIMSASVKCKINGPQTVSLKPDRKTAHKTAQINSDGRASRMTARPQY